MGDAASSCGRGRVWAFSALSVLGGVAGVEMHAHSFLWLPFTALLRPVPKCLVRNVMCWGCGLRHVPRGIGLRVMMHAASCTPAYIIRHLAHLCCWAGHVLAVRLLCCAVLLRGAQATGAFGPIDLDHVHAHAHAHAFLIALRNEGHAEPWGVFWDLIPAGSVLNLARLGSRV